MTTGWECPVCHKGCAPQALKCEHCAESKLAHRPPSPNAEVIGPGLWPPRRVDVTDAEVKRALAKLHELPKNEFLAGKC